MSDVALHVRDLLVAADRRPILRVDELSITSGEVVAIIGPNGAGKSTLLRACLGLRRPARGAITLLGRPIHRLGYRDRTRLRCAVGYVPQELVGHSQMPLTLREVVAIGRTGRAGVLHGLRRTDWQVTDACIDRLGLARQRHQSYAELSGGEQRKALIARALVQEPQMLVLDEPTAHLDLGWREHIVGTLQNLYEQSRTTLVIVCHEPEVLPACCRRVVLLDGGELVATGTPEDVLTQARVAALYGAGLRVLHAGGRHAVVPHHAAGDS